jgi:hypothetical protein
VPAVSASWGSLDLDFSVDCGRLDPESPSVGLVAQADATVVVVRPELADLSHLAPRLGELKAQAISLRILLAGAGPYSAEEVADAVGAEVVGGIPWDPAGARLLGGGSGSRRGLARTGIMRAARGVAAALAAGLVLQAGDQPATLREAANDNHKGARPAVTAS